MFLSSVYAVAAALMACAIVNYLVFGQGKYKMTSEEVEAYKLTFSKKRRLPMPMTRHLKERRKFVADLRTMFKAKPTRKRLKGLSFKSVWLATIARRPNRKISAIAL
ncbi:hypothetical protein JOE11_003484 [Robbsia andropogonis]|nr:hypothetical protein [Robbsia andropogonis]